MKITEGCVILFKLICFLIIPACSVFIGLLKPHVQDGTWPNGVAWWCAAIMAIANVANAGLAEKILPLEQIAGAIVQIVGRGSVREVRIAG